MSFITDFKSHLEANFSLDAYPFDLPQGTSLPAIVYEQHNFGRHNDSSLNASNIHTRRMQIYFVCDYAKEVIELSEQALELYEGFSGLMGTSKVWMIRVQTTLPTFNQQQKTYEYVIDMLVTIHK